MPFSPVARTRSETINRTSAEYVKFDPSYRVVLRMLDESAHQVYKHWIGAANGGKGLSPVCPNSQEYNNGNFRADLCPIEQEVFNLPKDNEQRKAAWARRRFVINVLDRTPYTVCSHCESSTPGVTKAGRPGVKTCIKCEADISKQDFEPLNKIKILEQGPRLFNDQLNVIADMQLADLKADITDYDITFTTTGSGREKKITAIPQDPKVLPESVFLDTETGEPQKKFDLDMLTEPESVEILELMREGATLEQINAVRNGETPKDE